MVWTIMCRIQNDGEPEVDDNDEDGERTVSPKHSGLSGIVPVKRIILIFHWMKCNSANEIRHESNGDNHVG